MECLLKIGAPSFTNSICPSATVHNMSKVYSFGVLTSADCIPKFIVVISNHIARASARKLSPCCLQYRIANCPSRNVILVYLAVVVLRVPNLGMYFLQHHVCHRQNHSITAQYNQLHTS